MLEIKGYPEKDLEHERSISCLYRLAFLTDWWSTSVWRFWATTILHTTSYNIPLKVCGATNILHSSRFKVTPFELWFRVDVRTWLRIKITFDLVHFVDLQTHSPVGTMWCTPWRSAAGHQLWSIQQVIDLLQRKNLNPEYKALMTFIYCISPSLCYFCSITQPLVPEHFCSFTLCCNTAALATLVNSKNITNNLS